MEKSIVSSPNVICIRSILGTEARIPIKRALKRMILGSILNTFLPLVFIYFA